MAETAFDAALEEIERLRKEVNEYDRLVVMANNTIEFLRAENEGLKVHKEWLELETETLRKGIRESRK